MTPKEKAIYLVEDFAKLDFGLNDKIVIGVNHKKQALIAMDEIIEALSFHRWQNRNEIEYYEEVKHEIEKL